MAFSFAGKTFVVTGGASGLGEATTRRLVSLGANVGLLDRDRERGPAIVSEFPKQVAFFEMDATDEASIKKAIDGVVAKFGAASLYGAVNCAGVGAATLTVDKRGNPHATEVFDFVMKVNVYGTFHTCKYVAAVLAKNPGQGPDGLRGVLINVASVAAFDGQKGQLAYAASKGAVTQMTLPMARDLGQFGIRVLTIAPGIFETPLMAAASDVTKKGLAESVVSPKRLGQSPEFALLVTQLIENPYMNGETLRLDAGIRMPYTSKI